jgi:hypothetical protein
MKPSFFELMQIIALLLPALYAILLNLTEPDKMTIQERKVVILIWLVIMILCQLFVCSIYKLF